ncbi:Dcm Site-specific DNA methylase [uncultured Caudovirales phage]|uniref:Cytosine-specific methyltransferase n=1 Tax=uncultured Caudovirales phage TaxID=2100421 RepID=A0A6J5LMD2_9CAUD|nr:Dcm Site-specific DNA methylase [uncultured Caudovirales phage]CAB4176269.1 Dcm Site-specific DNA methylase [uncultured Caudovirales phage]CAB4194763.1 Dcm Site-specific DNA methylase [uncultured Caudovirales phage]
MTLTVGSLFSGIGGLDLGLERAGMEVIWQSEIDPYACKVLSKHWPKVVNHGNIKDINWEDVVRPDVICGGYPCQPFSLNGHRAGQDDPRHLWPWVRNAISELRPQYAILENVRGHLTLGGASVIGDLTALGYDAEWHVISAASVGAPHRRDRIVIIAHPNNTGNRTSQYATNKKWTQAIEGQNKLSQCGSSGSSTDVAHNDSQWDGLNWSQKTARQARYFRADNTRREATNVSRQWWATEPDVGRVVNGVPSRVDRLRGLGNAVVPQVAELIGRMVVDYDTNF